MDERQFLTAIKRNTIFETIFTRLPDLDLPDAWIASGALFQTAWNDLTDRDPQYGIKDYDVVYYDDQDLSWEREDEVIKQCEDLFSDVEANIEVRNQARVPLWFEQKYGHAYPPINCSTDAIKRFLATICVIGIQPLPGRQIVYSPFGFTDLENMYIRPNLSCTFHPGNYLQKARRWIEVWPEAQLEEGGDQIYLNYVTGASCT